MMKYLSRRIMVLTALYVSIIFGIIALQFTRGNSFSLSIGPLMVSGSTEKNETGYERPSLPLHVGVYGLDFFLDDRNPLMAYTSANRGEPLKVTAFQPEDSRFTVSFTEGVKVTFETDKRGDIDIVAVSAVIPARFQRIVFPYKLARSARLEKKGSLNLVRTGKKLYSFPAIPLQPVAGSAARSLPILGSSPVVYYQTWLPAKGLSIAELAVLPGASNSAYERALEQFASAALVSFRDTVSSGALSEPIVAAYVAEMGRIGMYRAALESIPELYRNGPNRTWRTNTFFNNLEKTWVGMMTKEREDRTILSRRLTEGNPAILEFPSLVSYLVDRGSGVLMDDVIRVTSGFEISGVTPLQAAGILEIIMDMSRLDPERAAALVPLAESCERTLVSAMVRIQDKLYVSRDGKAVETLPSLRIASILIRYGSESTARAQWRAVGNLIVSSLLEFAGDSASLPARFLFSGTTDTGRNGVVAQAEQMLSAADLYPAVLYRESWYPHVLSLAAEAGPGVWTWTSAQGVQVSRPAEGVMKFTVRFQQGETHYMVLRGIKPFYRIQIYGMDFRTDPRFESYNSSGYRYDEQTETLFLKMRHKAENEDVVIYFGEPREAPGGDGSGNPAGGQTGMSPEQGTAGNADAAGGTVSPQSDAPAQ